MSNPKQFHHRPVSLLALCVATLPTFAGCSATPPPEAEPIASTSEAIQSTNASRFIPGVGHMNGYTCDTWPTDVVFGAPSNAYNALRQKIQQIGSSTSVTQLADLANAISAAKIERVTAIGATDELVVGVTDFFVNGNQSEPVAYAVDPTTLTGYTIDSRWLCTAGDLAEDANACATVPKELNVTGQIAKYSILRRSRARDDGAPADSLDINLKPQSVLLVAPTVRVRTNATVHSNLLVTSQNFVGGNRIQPGENILTRVPTATLTVEPTEFVLGNDATWRAALKVHTIPMLIGVVAENVGGASVASRSRAPIEQVTLLPNSSVSGPAYDVGSHRLTLPYRSFVDFSNFAWYLHSPNGSMRDYGVSLPPIGVRVTDVSTGTGAIIIHGHSGVQTSATAVRSSSRVGLDYDATELNHVFGAALRAFYNGNVLVNRILLGVDVSLDAPAQDVGLGGYDADYFSPSELETRIATNVTNRFVEQLNRAFVGGTVSQAAGGYFVAESLNEARAGALAVSNNHLFRAAYARADLASLETGVSSPLWIKVASLLDTPVSPVVLSIDTQSALTARRNAAYHLSGAANNPVKRNALGLPYGKVAVGWTSAQATGLQNLQAAEQRWQSVAALYNDFKQIPERFAEARQDATTQTLYERLSALSETVDQELSSINSASNTLKDAATVNLSVQSTTKDRMQTTLNALHAQMSTVMSGTTSVFGCGATCPGDGKLTSKLEQLDSACHNSGSALTELVGTAMKLVPVVNQINSIVQLTTGTDVIAHFEAVLPEAYTELNKLTEGLPGQEVLDDMQDILSQWDAQSSIISETLSANRWTEAIESKVNGATCSAGGDAQTNLDAFKRDLMLLSHQVKALALQTQATAQEMQAIQGHIAQLTIEKDSFGNLATQSSALRTQLRASVEKFNLPGPIVDWATFSTSERDYLANACRTMLDVTRTAQADLFLVSQIVETTMGRTATSPTLVVPEYPTDTLVPNANHVATYDGFAVSVWDETAFGRRFASGGSGTSGGSYMQRIHQRVTDLVSSEMCNYNASGSRSASRFVVRKVVKGTEFADFREKGTLKFSVDYEDLLAGGSVAGLNNHGIAVYEIGGNGQPARLRPLHSPIVLDARYSICTGSGANPCATYAEDSLPQVFLVGSGEAYATQSNYPHVPARYCDAGQSLYYSPTLMPDGIGQPDVCLHPMLTERTTQYVPAWSGGHGDTQLMDGVLSSICTSDPFVMQAKYLMGLPLLGSWAVTGSQASATELYVQGEASVRSLVAEPSLQSATGIEVQFVAGAAFAACRPGERAACSDMGTCNGAGTGCDCDDPTHRSGEDQCSTYHETIVPPGLLCAPTTRSSFCNWMGTCDDSGTTCICDDSEHRSGDERCAIWHEAIVPAGAVCAPSSDRGYCSWMGHCNGTGTGCVCDDPAHWYASERCSAYHQ